MGIFFVFLHRSFFSGKSAAVSVVISRKSPFNCLDFCKILSVNNSLLVTEIVISGLRNRSFIDGVTVAELSSFP